MSVKTLKNELWITMLINRLKENILIILCITLLSSSLNASAKTPLEQANNYYKQGQYKPALTLFEQLAEIGNIEAQHTLWVMYYNGQGTKQRFYEGFAWLAVAANYGDKKAAEEKDLIFKQLSSQQQSIAQVKMEEYIAQYGPKALSESLFPHKKKSFVEQANQVNRKGPKTITAIMPIYPADMLFAGIMGWVDIEYTLDQEGNVKNPVIKDAVPEGDFDIKALAAFHEFKFQTPDNQTANPKYLYRMLFTLDTTRDESLKELRFEKLSHKMGIDREKELKAELSDLKADGFGSRAGTHLSRALSNIKKRLKDKRYVEIHHTKLDNDLSDEKLLMALQGDAAAQYAISQKLLKGDGYIKNKNKAIKWLELSAAQDYKKAKKLLKKMNKK